MPFCRHRRTLGLAMALALCSVAEAQAQRVVPFGAGERLYFTVRSKVGTVGHAVMTLTATELGGTPTLLASFSTRIRVAFMGGSNEGRSWFDPQRMASFRYVENERRPFSSSRDSVEIDPETESLDEISFIHFLRTIEIAPDSLYSISRFYDKRRTPAFVRLVRRDTLRAPFGYVGVYVIDMTVKDKAARGGDKTIRLWLSEDRCRVPVRIETRLPYLGAGVMTIDSASTPGCIADTPREKEPELLS